MVVRGSSCDDTCGLVVEVSNGAERRVVRLLKEEVQFYFTFLEFRYWLGLWLLKMLL